MINTRAVFAAYIHTHVHTRYTRLLILSRFSFLFSHEIEFFISFEVRRRRCIRWIIYIADD